MSRTNLADGSLQHGIQASFRCVHVAGDALTFDHTRKLAHISCHAQDVVEAVGRATANLIVAGMGKNRRIVVRPQHLKEHEFNIPLAPQSPKFSKYHMNILCVSLFVLRSFYLQGLLIFEG